MDNDPIEENIGQIKKSLRMFYVNLHQNGQSGFFEKGRALLYGI